ncbi:MAG: MFS transporter [Verrucomicrobia bacterium]|nr:MFS transporter [Verrucomicrobiota bacterium]
MGGHFQNAVNDSARERSSIWKWTVCGLLLCASMLMYMDRQTLPSVATRITREFNLSQEQYGILEMCFGYAFAAGAFTFGFIADVWSVRWLYPAVLMAWSVMGFLTGLVESYSGLLVCRTLLGFFESGHWPCAIKTTQRLLSRGQRTMGNSVLQSGASVGAILTPLVMNWMLAGRMDFGLWRKPFLVIGSLGVLWLVAWFILLRESDFAPTRSTDASTDGEQDSAPPPEGEGSFWRVVFNPRFSMPVLLTFVVLLIAAWVIVMMIGHPLAVVAAVGLSFLVFQRRFFALVVMVACINTCWQVIRAWLPKFLQEGRGYLESEALYFNSLYYMATDIGCLGAGAVSLWLVKRAWSVHGSRSLVYGCCAVLTALTTLIVYLPKGWLLLATLLVVGAGALGLFPCYYSFTQELSTRHQGKVTGLLGTVAWATSSPAQRFFGRLVDQTGSFDAGLALAGWLPLIAFVFLWLFWDRPATGRATE